MILPQNARAGEHRPDDIDRSYFIGALAGAILADRHGLREAWRRIRARMAGQRDEPDIIARIEPRDQRGGGAR